MRKNQSIIATFSLALVFALIPGASAQTLSDIAGHKNEKAIGYLYEKDIISGYPDLTFKPDNTVNRAELLKILIGAKGIDPDPAIYSNCYPDVKNEWFAPWICYATSAGWVNGYPDGTFLPAKPLNKAEAIKMLVNSQEYSVPQETYYLPKHIAPDNYTYANPFVDVIGSEWFMPYIAVAESKGLLEESAILNADEAKTRGSISENIYRALIVTERECLSYDNCPVPTPATNIVKVDPNYTLATSENDLLPINLSESKKWEVEFYAYSLVDGELDGDLYRVVRDGDDFGITYLYKDTHYINSTGAYIEAGLQPYSHAILFKDKLELLGDKNCVYDALNLDCSVNSLAFPILLETNDIQGEHIIDAKDEFGEDGSYMQNYLVKIVGKTALPE